MKTISKSNKNLNKEHLDWLTNIINPNQYQTSINQYRKSHLFFKKDDKIFLLLDTKSNDWWFDYKSIYIPFKEKFGKNYPLFKKLTKDIMLNIHDTQVRNTNFCYF